MAGSLRLILDVDGVIRNILPSILKCYNRDAKHPATEADCKTYELAFIHNKEAFFIKHGEEIFRNSPIFPEVITALNVLRSYCDILFVSSQYSENARYTYDWMENHKIEGKDLSLAITWNKNEFRSDIIVDDNPDNLKGHNATHKFLFDAVYNRACNDYKRVYSLFHLIYELEIRKCT